MFNAIVDYFKEVIEGIKERVRNPFTERNSTPFAGAFLIALIVYNWQLIFSILSFDSKETRLSKIEIITQYLSDKSWVGRIGWPVAIAFGSILLFYIFNYLSLGLTTVFNRWFKASILYYTDRSKIITRDEFERINKRATSTKNNYERIKNELLSSEEERSNLDQQLTELNEQYRQAVIENERLKNEVQAVRTTTTTTTTGARDQFRILYARYGEDESNNDVTEIVNKLFKSSRRFTVDNKTLEGDPAPYSIKQLFVVYEQNNVTNTLTAIEGQILELRDGQLHPIKTDVSIKKQTHLTNEKKIGDIFSGPWVLTFTSSEGTPNSEPIFIDNEARYFAHSKLRFYLRTINIDERNKRITFNKVDLKRKLHAKETLTIQDSDFITGTDSKGYKLEYRRQKNMDTGKENG